MLLEQIHRRDRVDKSDANDKRIGPIVSVREAAKSTPIKQSLAAKLFETIFQQILCQKGLLDCVVEKIS